MMGPARYESQERNESPAAMGAAAGHRWLRRVAGGLREDKPAPDIFSVCGRRRGAGNANRRMLAGRYGGLGRVATGQRA